MKPHAIGHTHRPLLKRHVTSTDDDDDGDDDGDGGGGHDVRHKRKPRPHSVVSWMAAPAVSHPSHPIKLTEYDQCHTFPL